MRQGIGYRDYCQWRSRVEGVKTSLLETPGYERYVIYFGRTHLIDADSGFEARGLLKIGQAKYVNTVQRGRNQAGASFRVYAEITLEDDQATREAEAIAKKLFNHMHVHGDEGQTELYQFVDADITTISERLAAEIAASTSHHIKDVIRFKDGMVYSRNSTPSPVIASTFDNMFEWSP